MSAEGQPVHDEIQETHPVISAYCAMFSPHRVTRAVCLRCRSQEAVSGPYRRLRARLSNAARRLATPPAARAGGRWRCVVALVPARRQPAGPESSSRSRDAGASSAPGLGQAAVTSGRTASSMPYHRSSGGGPWPWSGPSGPGWRPAGPRRERGWTGAARHVMGLALPEPTGS